MSMRVEDLGELAYGGLVTGAREWDKKRITDGAITDKDVLKKYSFYTYLAPGLAATAMSAFGWGRQFESWNEHVSHGFIYDFPGFIVGLINDLRSGSTAGAKSAAIKEAQRVMKETRQLPPGRQAARTYQPEFEESQKYAW